MAYMEHGLQISLKRDASSMADKIATEGWWRARNYGWDDSFKFLTRVTLILLLIYLYDALFAIAIIWLEFFCPANEHPKTTIKKKIPQTFAHLVNVSKETNVSTMSDDPHTILLFWINKYFTCSRCDLRLISTRRTTCAEDHGCFFVIDPLQDLVTWP